MAVCGRAFTTNAPESTTPASAVCVSIAHLGTAPFTALSPERAVASLKQTACLTPLCLLHTL